MGQNYNSTSSAKVNTFLYWHVCRPSKRQLTFPGSVQHLGCLNCQPNLLRGEIPLAHNLSGDITVRHVIHFQQTNPRNKNVKPVGVGDVHTDILAEISCWSRDFFGIGNNAVAGNPLTPSPGKLVIFQGIFCHQTIDFGDLLGFLGRVSKHNQGNRYFVGFLCHGFTIADIAGLSNASFHVRSP